MVGEEARAAIRTSRASPRPRDGDENRHFFGPRERRADAQRREKLRRKVRISRRLRLRWPQGTY